MIRLNAVTMTIVIVAALFRPVEMFAQAVSNAQIHGVITDSTDAVVPGAQLGASV